MNGSASIRNATPEDQCLIEDLRASVGWSTGETGLTSMLRGRSVIYILEVDGVPAASGALVLYTEDPDLADDDSNGLVSNLIVEPKFQGQGLGTRLLHYLEEQARNRGFKRLTIGVDSSNERAKRLYEREGYSSLKDKLEAWGPVNYLVKPLDA